MAEATQEAALPESSLRPLGAHEFLAEDWDVLREITDWISSRLMNRDRTACLPRQPLPEVTKDGAGIAAAWTALRDVVLPTSFPTDHPRYLAFVGGAPTPAAVLADTVLSAAAIYGGSELEAGAVVEAERAALRWLSDLIGYPPGAHGAFVSGGSLANLSALVAARHGRTTAEGRPPSTIIVGASAHSSIRSAAAIMGCRVEMAGSPDAPMTAGDLEPVLQALDADDIVAVVATAGATNTGAIDALDGIAESCRSRGIWLHVDAAYGGAALLAPVCRSAFRGIEQADSVTIDPHKWLFTPFDCAAVVYRDPAPALAAHRQHAHYLDAANAEGSDNPADYAVHLTRRARGVPLWASLVANGTDAYTDAVERCLALAVHAVKRIDASENLEVVVDPQLSVVLFRRVGWAQADYVAWSHQARLTGLALVTPTTLAGETVLRLCFVNPLSTEDDVDLVLESIVGESHRARPATTALHLVHPEQPPAGPFSATPREIP